MAQAAGAGDHLIGTPLSTDQTSAPNRATLDRATADRAVADGAALAGGFGLYVHWPFCASLCPYCDFNSHVRSTVDHRRWAAALRRELAHFAGQVGRRRLRSIFFGGGTPSLMDPATVAVVIDGARFHFDIDNNIEITLEANPGSVDRARFADFRQAGVDRVSLGVQALDDAALRALGRRHSAAEALAALTVARETFARVSFDLIHGRPGQTEAAWATELDQALALEPDHLSVYQLTIEPGTAFHAAARRGELTLPDEDTQAALFEHTHVRLQATGLRRYEVSNHARPGAESRHNLIYWQGGGYIGIGPGAHGRLPTGPHRMLATRQHRAPERWLETTEQAGHATTATETITGLTRARELLLMGLRLADGIRTDRFARQTGTALTDHLEPEGIADCVALGLLTHTPDQLALTDAGLPLLNAILAKIVR